MRAGRRTDAEKSQANSYTLKAKAPSLLLLEKVPAAAGECGGDTYNECQSG